MACPPPRCRVLMDRLPRGWPFEGSGCGKSTESESGQFFGKWRGGGMPRTPDAMRGVVQTGSETAIAQEEVYAFTDRAGFTRARRALVDRSVRQQRRLGHVAL